MFTGGTIWLLTHGHICQARKVQNASRAQLSSQLYSGEGLRPGRADASGTRLLSPRRRPNETPLAHDPSCEALTLAAILPMDKHPAIKHSGMARMDQRAFLR